jgi:uncharacterized OB-fold protein
VAKITLDGWKCERCGHVWVPRQQDAPEPRVCPKCKSPYWNRPRKTAKSTTKKGTKGT